jgi:hypothetical protein
LLRNIRQIYVTLQLSQIHQITQVFYKSEKKSKKKVWLFSFLSILAAAPPREETSRRSAMQPLAPCCWLLTGEYAALTAYHPAIARPPPSFACLTQLPLPRSRRRYYLSLDARSREQTRGGYYMLFFLDNTIKYPLAN